MPGPFELANNDTSQMQQGK